MHDGSEIAEPYAPIDVDMSILVGGAVVFDSVGQASTSIDEYIAIDGIEISTVLPASPWSKVFRIRNEVPVFRIAAGSGLCVVFASVDEVALAERMQGDRDSLRKLLNGLRT